MRLTLVVLGIVAVLAIGLLAARLWVGQQYYVGVDSDRVVIYQGVRGSVLGVQLQHIAEPTGIRVEDLTQVGRSSVEGDGLPADGLEGARNTVERLRSDEMLPVCRPPAPPPAPVVVPGAPGAPPVTITPAPAPQPPQVPGRDCRQVP